MRSLPVILLVAVAACSPTPEQDTATQVVAATGEPAEPEPEPTPTTSPAPDDFANTAWRSTAENGALFVTYLDEGGTYRDLRNGDPYQTGTWEYADNGQLCLTPETEEAEGGCWEPGRMRDGGLLTLTSGERRIQVSRITYEAPEEEEDAAES